MKKKITIVLQQTDSTGGRVFRVVRITNAISYTLLGRGTVRIGDLIQADAAEAVALARGYTVIVNSYVGI